MTERTKGPAVSMRRPPTRGPQDPWTPRKIALRGHLFSPYPRRPTLDGPAHDVRLHGPYVCGTPHTMGNPAPRRAAHAAKIGLAGFPAPPSLRDTPRPAPPPALHFLFIGLSGRGRATYLPGLTRWLSFCQLLVASLFFRSRKNNDNSICCEKEGRKANQATNLQDKPHQRPIKEKYNVRGAEWGGAKAPKIVPQPSQTSKNLPFWWF